MCAAPISAGEAAWTEADTAWEQLQVGAAQAFAAHDLAGAAERWALVLRTARTHFAADDPQLATSLANYAAAAFRQSGKPVPARLWEEARAIWDAAPVWLARQRFAPRARSSIFHLRLEAKHGSAYDENLRRRAETLLDAARAAGASLAAGAPTRPPDRAVFKTFLSAPRDAMRKVLAAAHLLAAPASDQDAEAQAAQEGS
jgi:hypothetical protein